MGSGPEQQAAGVQAPDLVSLEREKLRFERQKLAIDLRLKRRELNKDDDKGGLKERLSNPLVIAIVGGIITLLTNTVSNYLTGRENRASETLKATLAEQSARETLQADLIKKFVESQKIEVVRQNLKFLADSGLIPTYADSIKAYLKAYPDSAPRVGSGVDFSTNGEVIDDSAKEEIQDTVTGYRKFLQSIGFLGLDQSVSVYIFSADKPPPNGDPSLNAYYMNGTVFIHKSLAGELTVALREYTHHALYTMLSSHDFRPDEIESAIADYLPASFLDTPVIGKELGKLFGLSTNYIRRIDNDTRYERAAFDPVTKGQVWASVLWSCRQKIGHDRVDQLVLSAWMSAVKSSAASDDIAGRFGKTLSSSVSPMGECFTQEIAHRHIQ